MTGSTAKLAAALAKVQAQLPKLERDRTVTVQQKNGGEYSYSYATLAKVSEAVLPLLAENELSFVAMPGLGADGKMCVRYSLLHSSGEALTGEFPISGEGGIQMIGGRITYARRYCLAAVVGIAADEDDESRLSDDAARPAQRAAAKQRQKAPETRQGRPAQRDVQRAPQPPLPGENAQQSDPVTGGQLTKIATVFGVIGWTEREDKLRAASTIVGRALQSSKELTKSEAHTLIETLEMVASGPDPADKLTELLADIRSAEERGGES